ncbi:MAG TPA: hypothetical protein P5056_00645 [Candidatus Paceibacterota bacterium]|nr:hypothetical protein [Candidatus Paceibacterota bacterium]
MGYPFRRKYEEDARAMMISIDMELIKPGCSESRRLALHKTRKLIQCFVRYKKSIEDRIIFLQYDAYSVGESFGSLADDELFSVLNKISLGYTGDDMDLFVQLDEIDTSLGEIERRIVLKHMSDEEKRKQLLDFITKENKRRDRLK